MTTENQTPTPMLHGTRLPAIIAELQKSVGILTGTEGRIVKMQGHAIIQVQADILMALTAAELERKHGAEALAENRVSDTDIQAATEHAALVLQAGLLLIAETMPTAATKAVAAAEVAP